MKRVFNSCPTVHLSEVFYCAQLIAAQSLGGLGDLDWGIEVVQKIQELQKVQKVEKVQKV